MPRKFREIAAALENNPEDRAQIDEYEREMRAQLVLLQRLREHKQVTQHELAAALGVSQGNVSRIEHQDDPQVSTVRRFVEALGGRLVMQARLEGETIDLLALAEE